MKFHHIARHSQSVAQQQQHDLIPTKHQQATSTTNSKQQLNHMSDEEDDDFNDNQSFYDIIDQQQLNNMQQQQAAANLQTRPIDPSGFLIDKNKKLFPQKLWELIHNPSIQHCLRWSQDGQRVYLNRNEFEAYYLKTPNNQFHTQKAISFVRQMNMYGFRKVDDCYYENDNFRRDRQHLLRNMIRRHPNKGLFVGLDHHQLAAAAAAQQALQVNQQLQQLEHQHKHRTEQALRLNNYLNSHHQFHHHHQSALAHAGHLHSHHSSPFEQMSSQLAQAAANHLSHQHQHQQHQHLQHHHHHTQIQQGSNKIPADTTSNSVNSSSSNNNNNHATQLSSVQQPKKSRLLNNFYAASVGINNNNTNSNAAINNNNISASSPNHNQDSMHSTSSLDTQPSQCSSVVNSGSAGSPQPNSPTALQQRLAALTGATNYRHLHTQSGSSTSIRAALLAAAAADGQEDPLQNGNLVSKFGAHQQGAATQQAATDLSSQSLASRQALHQTLVRSLLQLKHQHPQEIWASLQQHQQTQQNSRALLESLASLSSAGTGSIVDPASNSPTERTSTPPSSPPSPSALESVDPRNYCAANQFMPDNGGPMALDLAKSSHGFGFDRKLDSEPMRRGEERDDGTEVEGDAGESGGVAAAKSPLDGAKKVRRFLERLDDASVMKFKREPEHNDLDEVDEALPRTKRIKTSDSLTETLDDDETSSISSMSKSLIIEMCDRRGNQLDVTALQEAAKYTECFLEVLLEDAALIAQHSSPTEGKLNDANEGDQDEIDDEIKDSETLVHSSRTKKAGIVDTSSLSLALKLIPSKLLGAIQQQVNIRTQSSVAV